MKRWEALMLTPAQRRQKLLDVVRVASGNFLEMYDFFVFGYFAVYIGNTFFPSEDQFVSLMLSLGTFGAGFFMRPLGAVVLGSYIDRKGRRTGLILTLGLMAVGTITIACTPGYQSIGLLAPALVVVGRLVQGFSAGVELGGVSVYLAEIATPGHKGFYCAWQSASQQVAVIFASLLGVALDSVIPAEQMAAWGWRIPLLIGCLIIPLILFLRRSLKETEEFAAQRHHPTGREVRRLIAENWRVVFEGILLSGFTTTTFYLITVYTPTFGREVLHFEARDNLLVTLCVGVSNLFWLPIGGAISDKVGRRPMLILLTSIALITAYPAMMWLVSEPSFNRLLLVELWFSLIFGIYNGAMIPFLTEMMPPKVRTSGFSIAFSFATAVFGGMTPAVCTYLIHVTGNAAMPGAWLSVAAALALGSTFVARSFVSSAAGQEAVA
jgi:MFS transporter, MHS family, citrate/tricarballylate:H+ symporter